MHETTFDTNPKRQLNHPHISQVFWFARESRIYSKLHHRDCTFPFRILVPNPESTSRPQLAQMTPRMHLIDPAFLPRGAWVFASTHKAPGHWQAGAQRISRANRPPPRLIQPHNNLATLTYPDCVSKRPY